MTIRSDLTERINALNIEDEEGRQVYVSDRITAPPFVIVAFGGSAGDDALAQGAFTIFVTVTAGHDPEPVVAPIYRMLRESGLYIPLSVASDPTPPGVDADAVTVTTIVGDTTFAWWSTGSPVA